MNSPWSRALLATAVFVAAIAPRASTWSGTFARPFVLLEEVDAWYHLRRIELALANNLVLPALDTYNNHPFGATVDWPPGFDLFFALIWHLLANVLALPLSPAAVGAVGVAVLGSLAAAAVAVLAVRWSPGAGIVAGLAVAWSPAAVAYSRVGRLDHHAIEPLSLVVLCAAYVWCRRGDSAVRAVVLGGVLGLGTFFWVGSAFYAVALALAFGLEALTRGAAVAGHASLCYLVAAGISSGLALFTPWGRQLEVVYYALSWFQPLVFGALALVFGGIAWLERRGTERRRAWLLGALALAVLAALVLLTRTASVGRGLDFLLGADPVAATVLESRSLAETGLGYALSWLTPVALSLPLLWVSALVLARRLDRMDPLLAAGLSLGLLAMPFALLQMRFGPHAAVVSALLMGWLVAQTTRPLVTRAAVAAVAAMLAWGVRPATLPDSMVHPYVLGGFDALVWLRNAPSSTSHFRDPTRRPEYGVAAEWIWGHWITQIGQKPNIANPLGQTVRNLQGIEEVARLFLAESEDEARASLERLDVRYVLLSSIPATISELAVQAERDPARYVERNPAGRETFLPPFYDTFHTRLYVGGGAGEGGTEPVPGVRLVFESRVQIEFLGSRSAVRIFEVVPGAVLRGRCPQGVVEARAELEGSAPTGSDLTYTVREAPEADGAFALRMPYASEPAEAAIPARITVHCGDAVTDAQVPERAVLDGRDVAVRPVTRP